MTRSRPVVLAAVGAALLAAVRYQRAGCGLLEPCQSEPRRPALAEAARRRQIEPTHPTLETAWLNPWTA